MGSMSSQITSLTIVYSAVYSGAGQFPGNWLGTGEFPAQMASNAENVSIGWRNHVVHSKLVVDYSMQISWPEK